MDKDEKKKTIIRTGHKCISVANGRFKLLNEYHFELKWMKESVRSSAQAAAHSFSVGIRSCVMTSDHLYIIIKAENAILWT